MPFTPESFRARHNQSLSDAQARKAAGMANAMMNRGVDEGVAIATANKHATAPIHRHPKSGRFVPAKTALRFANTGGKLARPTQ